MDNEYRLNATQAEFCCTVLVKELVEISAQLARGAREEERHLAVAYSVRLQTTLLSLGMTSEDLEKIVKRTSRWAGAT